jgi:c-di-GMP-binding flagellar brake protein YcgR
MESERREFTRLRSRIGVRFKYLTSSLQHSDLERVYEGTTTNLSIGGLLLAGPLPQLDWIKELLLGRMSIGVNLQIPKGVEPLKALARLTWIESFEDGSMATRMGLKFQEMPAEHRRALSEFLVREAMA